MRRLVIFSVILSAIVAVSCAETEKFDYTDKEREAFDLWMAKYYPDADTLPGGKVYYEWIEQSGSDVRLNSGYWMKLNYTGRLFDGGTIYTTRDAANAETAGFYYPVIYYAPDYMQYYPAGIKQDYFAEISGLTDGQVEMLKYMAEGDSVRIYMYATEAYNYNFSGITGYVPSTSLAGRGSSVIMDMKLVNVVADPLLFEYEQVKEYAVNVLGMDEDDYLEPGLYVNKTEEYPDADIVGSNTYIGLYYTLRSLDGHVFKTNDMEVAIEAGIFDSSTSSYMVEMLTPDESRLNDEIEAFGKALLTMRFGERATAVFISDYGYTINGNSSLFIPPYTPLIYDLYVVDGYTSE